MKRPSISEERIWRWLFIGLLPFYCLYYAPYGVNETDGGFLTGLGWQLLNGKTLYQDVLYVRPPLPVYLRALELCLLPEHYAILGERWIFYLKVWLYSLMAASLLEKAGTKWLLAVLGFIVSAHCYPAMAWHTVDGIFFAVLSVFLLYKTPGNTTGFAAVLFAGASLTGAVLCKQSFYPLLLLMAVVLWWAPEIPWKKKAVYWVGFFLTLAVFSAYMVFKGTMDAFLSQTGGATDSGQALQHGILDYFSITPELALPTLLLVLVGLWRFKNNKTAVTDLIVWDLWAFGLVASYAAVTWLRQEHTAPFAQSRILFDLSAVYLAVRVIRSYKVMDGADLRAIALLGIGWCAAVSWGYALPILFSTPWIWGTMMLRKVLVKKIGEAPYPMPVFNWVMVGSLLLAFRVGFEFVYRDGLRSEMNVHLGDIFPKAGGIYTDRESADLYSELKALSAKYGPAFTVLPAFPQANFLTNTYPPLPLNWVVNREMSGNNQLILNELNRKKSIVFFEKKYLNKLDTDPELAIDKFIFDHARTVEETNSFLVLVNE